MKVVLLTEAHGTSTCYILNDSVDHAIENENVDEKFLKVLI